MSDSTDVVKVELTNQPSKKDALMTSLITATATVIVSSAATVLTSIMAARAQKRFAQQVETNTNPSE